MNTRIQGHILLELYSPSHEINFSLLTIVTIIGYTLHKKKFFDVPVKYLHLNKSLPEHKTEGNCLSEMHPVAPGDYSVTLLS